MKNLVSTFSLYFAWLLALIATLFSLYYSEILQIQPCTLCWYQRICLFPLAWILAMAAYRNEEKIAFYVYPQLLLGAVLAFYQLLLPYLGGSFLCGGNSSCQEKAFLWLFLPLPLWSLLTFGGIFFFLRRAQKKRL